MIDLKAVTAVALDVAGAQDSYERQNALSEFIWHLLERHYRLYLFNTEAAAALADEDFIHPGLVFLRGEMPPDKAMLEAHPRLGAAETLWITDAPLLQRWLQSNDQSFMHLVHGPKPTPGGQHLVRLSELSALLDRTALLLHDVTSMIGESRRFRTQGALLIGLGGPPRSGFQQFAVDLRRHLHDSGHALVELLDLSSLMHATEELVEAGAPEQGVWQSAEIATWLQDAVFAPLRTGQAVFVEARPPQLPKDFDPHFPLFISETAIVLVFAELLFVPDVMGALDLSVLLDVSPDETARRLYEIPSGERLDPKFSAQYMSREGRIYQEYLVRNRVREQVSLRVDANLEHSLRLRESGDPPIVS